MRSSRRDEPHHSSDAVFPFAASHYRNSRLIGNASLPIWVAEDPFLLHFHLGFGPVNDYVTLMIGQLVPFVEKLPYRRPRPVPGHAPELRRHKSLRLDPRRLRASGNDPKI